MTAPIKSSLIDPQLSPEEAEIARVIHAETQLFINEDYDAWSQCFLHNERVRDVSMSAGTGLIVVKGWKELSALVDRVFKDDLGCKIKNYRKDNMQISVDANMAWAMYDGWIENTDGACWESFTTCILERTGGGWKIVYHAFADVRHVENNLHTVSVDKSGKLLWASQNATEALREHKLLMISAGKVRARRRDWDKALQKAITHAGDYHDFFELRRFTDETGGPLDYPVVMGDTDEGGVAVVQLSVRDAVTYLHFDVTGSLDRKLAVAQAVFGLSDGQLRIAHQIAQGFGLKCAAQALDISINTARTHLSRLYEKTGVSSQTALVRILLSVG